MKRLMLAILLLLALAGCTEQQRARGLGGTATQNVPAKIVNATWKNADLWILTRDPLPGETPTTYRFQESASWGVIEGTVILKETFKPITVKP